MAVVAWTIAVCKRRTVHAYSDDRDYAMNIVSLCLRLVGIYHIMSSVSVVE